LVSNSLHLSTPEEIEDLVRANLRKKFPEEFGENFNYRLTLNEYKEGE
jgi:hypothetical protein